MSDLDDHVRFEALVAEAYRAPDPAAALAALVVDERVPESFRATLQALEPDGVRVSGLLIARLRFERLIHGSERAAAWFDEDPDAFAEAFREYHQAVVPTEAMPTGEARLFERWLDQRNTSS